MFYFNGSISKRHKDREITSRSYSISGCKSCYLFLSWLYKDASIYLDRKYEKFLDFVQVLKNRSIQSQYLGCIDE